MSRVDLQRDVAVAEQEVVGAAVRLADWVRLNHPHAVRPEEQEVIDCVDRLEDAMKAAERAEGERLAAARKAEQRKKQAQGAKR